ncbi:MAG: energy-coupling factor ABC transporter ATP-binding protein [Cycloclasticus sp. symbiont of Poecilosclerida sp. M]|nr:MAG: energy-coupling factor ABC transporter ATP-binding protein [Cycloclasticus sp. symbiont of Poecilosclerida sp. M]
MTPIITIKNLSLSYSGKQLLDIAQLTLEQQQCTLLTGCNGSGKTSLLKIISGLLQPQHAEIEYQDLDLSWKKAKSLIQKDFIYMHQQPYLFDDDVINNISYGLLRYGENKARAHKKVMEALDWAGISHLAYRQAKLLSGGEKQRVALTRARILSPRLLLLDEPTASMDIGAKAQTSSLLQRLKKEGVSILITSHEAHTIDQLADRHLLLHNGQITDVATSTYNDNVITLKTAKRTHTK